MPFSGNYDPTSVHWQIDRLLIGSQFRYNNLWMNLFSTEKGDTKNKQINTWKPYMQMRNKISRHWILMQNGFMVWKCIIIGEFTFRVFLVLYWTGSGIGLYFILSGIYGTVYLLLQIAKTHLIIAHWTISLRIVHTPPYLGKFKLIAFYGTENDHI